MSSQGKPIPEFTQTIHVPSSANDCDEWKGREIQLWGKPRFYEGASATQVRMCILCSTPCRAAFGQWICWAQTERSAPTDECNEEYWSALAGRLVLDLVTPIAMCTSQQQRGRAAVKNAAAALPRSKEHPSCQSSKAFAHCADI